MTLKYNSLVPLRVWLEDTIGNQFLLSVQTTRLKFILLAPSIILVSYLFLLHIMKNVIV